MSKQWEEASKLLVATGRTTANRPPASQVDDVVSALHVEYTKIIIERDKQIQKLKDKIKALKIPAGACSMTINGRNVHHRLCPHKGDY